jgi:hypothetical protein
MRENPALVTINKNNDFNILDHSTAAKSHGTTAAM